MRSILVLNPKGGCGKTTVATNLAAYYAVCGKSVLLADFDPQNSSMDWLAERPEWCAEIKGFNAAEERFRVNKNTDVLIMDAPAGTHGKELNNLLRRSSTVIMPISPSPLDVRVASRFLEELKQISKVIKTEVKLATVANRVREHTLAGQDLSEYLAKLKLPDGKKFPFLTTLRASQNYIRAAQRGMSIFEFSPSVTNIDREQWKPLIRWLKSAKSQP